MLDFENCASFISNLFNRNAIMRAFKRIEDESREFSDRSLLIKLLYSNSFRSIG